MPGFRIYRSDSGLRDDVPLVDLVSENRIVEHMDIDGWKIDRNSLEKFGDDKVFSRYGADAVVTEGVTYNRKQLVGEWDASDYGAAIVKMAAADREFFSKFRGPFSGAYYDGSSREWIIWTNQTGECPVFYYSGNGRGGSCYCLRF